MPSLQPTRTTDTPRRRSGGVSIRPADRPLSDAPSVMEIVRESASPAQPVVDVVPRTRSELACRALNVAIAGSALVALSPVLMCVAAAIKLTSRGPVFYRQPRVGIDRRWNSDRAWHDRRVADLGGEIFHIYKFRSMTTDAEKNGKAVWASQSDARVTPIGKFIRAFRIDEVPQLLNVLKGDMNIVGPRPERPSIFMQLKSDIGEYAMRQRSKPGITGWAQINQSYDTNIDDVRRKVKYDLEYISRQGVAMDLRIMAMTLPVMLFRRGGW